MSLKLARIMKRWLEGIWTARYVDFLPDRGHGGRQTEVEMKRRPRCNHSLAFKAKMALRAIRNTDVENH